MVVMVARGPRSGRCRRHGTELNSEPAAAPRHSPTGDTHTALSTDAGATTSFNVPPPGDVTGDTANQRRQVSGR